MQAALPSQVRVAPGAPLARRAGAAIRNVPGQTIEAATHLMPALRTLPRAVDRAIGAGTSAVDAAVPQAQMFYSELTGGPLPDRGGTPGPSTRGRATGAVTPDPTPRTPGPSTRGSNAPFVPPAPRDFDAEVNALFPGGAGPTPPVNFADVPAERQTSFDIGNSQRYMVPNQNTASIPVPASLSAPAWGAGAQLAPQEGGGPQVIRVGNSGLRREGTLTPGNRNFDPVAFRASIRQQALDNQLALGELDANTRLGAAQIGAGADMARALAAAQAGIQERALANQGALATAQLTGQFGLAGREATAAGTVEAARLRAQGQLGAAQVGADPAGDAAQAQLRQAQAQEILFRQLLAREARETGAPLQEQAGLSRAGQQGNVSPVMDQLGRTIGYSTPYGILPIDERSGFGAYARLEQQRQTTR